MKLTAIILTYNEELHLSRCLESIKDIASHIVVADSYSTDKTVEIARSYSAAVIQNPWLNYATQFNWALSQLPGDSEWILRIDADEYLTPELITEIREQLPLISKDVDGIYINRWMTFQRRKIIHGGVFPVHMLRLFRYGKGQCENRWMDEHIKVAGATVDFSGDLIDDNLNNLTWWTDKHNKYANREAVELLNVEYGFMEIESIATLSGAKQASVKRWLKEKVYTRLPSGFRAFAYFFYRYVIRLGFLDGQEGTAFHVLQGFWYRYLVDAKVVEVKRYMASNQVDAKTAIHIVLDIRL